MEYQLQLFDVSAEKSFEDRMKTYYEALLFRQDHTLQTTAKKNENGRQLHLSGILQS